MGGCQRLALRRRQGRRASPVWLCHFASTSALRSAAVSSRYANQVTVPAPDTCSRHGIHAFVSPRIGGLASVWPRCTIDPVPQLILVPGPGIARREQHGNAVLVLARFSWLALLDHGV